ELPRGKFVKLSARPGQKITVLDFVTGRSYFDQAIRGDVTETLRSLPQNQVPVLGRYQREPVENDWHVGRITQGPNNLLKWTNRANVSWTLTPDLGNRKLLTGPDNPYQKINIRDFHLEMANGRATGFRFNNELYRRTGD
ncbi:MAG: hypothetical protein AB7I30_06075, partial [Isosphaeraceae bacterium]